MTTFFVACVGQEKNNEVVFVATVLENKETHLLVEPVEGSAELSSADKIMVYVQDTTLLHSNDNSIAIGDFKAGQLVEITYNGAIAESYPAQIHTCYQINLLN
ncbi:hypothetical protein BKP35_04760 [Anaerobacillus arseniciselenatis]|uniref:DUF3221 domain-containing protein n=2 Tax=Anaerobacillus arseniciselenatis TaxID=85682 RepID=A0A1S2LSE1_9BACI|nr:hypothetical protein BKP35_04760 [Anaerobacillus arseniciselenatis]